MSNLLCEIELLCIQGEVNWALLAVMIPLVLLTLLIASFCLSLFVGALKAMMHRFLGRTKHFDKNPDV
tara:strand:- start:674 stop:877 length:204 start_codon:yes stop_codon:yes gene_type:complete